MTMTANELRASLQELLRLLQFSDIALTFRPVVIQRVSSGRRRVTWSPSLRRSPQLFHGSFATPDEYRAWIEAESYSALLYDGSFLQLSYDFHGTSMVAHRLVFYPCPYEIDLGLLKEEPTLDVIDLYEGGGSTIRLASPLRFEYDSAGQAEGHPASHLTINGEHCRWAVTSPLSPGHFIRFVFRHFYPSLWRNVEFIREWPQIPGPKTISDSEESMLHVSCGRH